ncbi:MAG: isopentenyl phosphate kinase family protein [Candidatus Altiarchaeota archaeon]|nr:isopentenyl phosphate kinase family protein [Candidatus Altiarchaeota archaeon]
MDELVILKLGGSVITKKSDNKREVDRVNLRRLCQEIAEAIDEKRFRLLVVHGAGPFGHVPAQEYGLDKGLRSGKQLKGFSLTRQSMEELNSYVVDALLEAGINAISYQPSAVGVLSGGKLIYFPTKVLAYLLEMDMVPVSYGDVLVDEKTGVGILSGDHLVPYLARKLHASRVIITTDVDGIFDVDPKGGGSSELIKEITQRNMASLSVGKSRGTDVTGGMKRKLDELLRLAGEGINSEVISGVKPGILKRSLLGEKNLGTLIRE